MTHKFSIILAVAALGFFGWIGCGAGDDSKGDWSLYGQVIQRVEKGEIKTEEEKGVTIPKGSIRLPFSAQLPADLRQASVDGEIYAYRPSTNQLFIVFKTWIGKGFNMKGFLYAAKPLASEITKDNYGQSVVAIGPMDLVLEKQLNPNRYQISYQLD